MTPSSPKRPLRLLCVDDSEDDVLLLLRELRRNGYDPLHERVCTAAAMRAAISRQAWQLVISDYHMPNFDPFEALRILKESGRDLPFILVSGIVDERTAVAAMKAGAVDYIMKRDLARLVPAIERELREAEVRAARRTAEEALRQSEEQLRQAQKLEAIGRLAGGVAHDFNNILTAIAGYSELAVRELKAGQPAHDHVVEIQKATERAAALTRQLLAFSRKQTLQPKVIDLNAVVSNLDKMLHRLIGEHIEFKTVLERSLPPVKADPGQIEQVIMNLAVNSRDAMPDGGHLTVQTSHVRLTDPAAPRPPGLPATDWVVLAVADNGSGMSEEVKARIFEPFFTTKEPGKGTGLGLAMCYGIVQQSGGHISVESQHGHGTTFRIFLPVATESLPAATVEPARASPAAPRGQTILVAEDEDVVRELTSYLLREQGYNVLVSPDGVAALAQASQYEGNIDLLLTDAVMPRMGGKELAQHLRRQRRDLRVLLASGYSADVFGPAAVGDGPLEFLQKPFTPAVLLAKVQHVLS